MLGGGAVEGRGPGPDVEVHGVDVPDGVPACGFVLRYVGAVGGLGLDAGCAVQGGAVEGVAFLGGVGGWDAVGAGGVVDGAEEAGGPGFFGGADFGHGEVVVGEVGGCVELRVAGDRGGGG